MNFQHSALFPGDIHDTAIRLAAEFSHASATPNSSVDQASPAWQKMLELGWQGVWIAEADGGFGATLTDLASIVEALGAHALVSPLIERAGMVPAILGAFAQQTQVRDALEQHASGEASIGAVMSTAGQLKGEVHMPQLDNHGQLSGTLRAVDLSEPVSHLLFQARQANGQNCLLLTHAAPLLQTARIYRSNDGRRIADLSLNAIAIDAQAVLASGAPATQAMVAGLSAGALLSCVQTVGSAASLIAQSIEYLNTREQFGVQLSTFQALRHRLVDMYVAYENTFCAIRQQVQMHAHQTQSLQSVLTTKLYVNHVARQIGESAIQLHGGMGMTTETQAARLAVRVISTAFDCGDNAQCLDWLSEHALQKAA